MNQFVKYTISLVTVSVFWCGVLIQSKAQPVCKSIASTSSSDWTRKEIDNIQFLVAFTKLYKPRCQFWIFVDQKDFTSNNLRKIGIALANEYKFTYIWADFWTSKDIIIGEMAATKTIYRGWDELPESLYKNLPKEDPPNTDKLSATYFLGKNDEFLVYDFLTVKDGEEHVSREKIVYKDKGVVLIKH